MVLAPGREGNRIGVKVTRQGVRRAPLRELIECPLRSRARVGSWGPCRVRVASRRAQGRYQKNDATLRARPGVLFCVFHILSFSLSPLIMFPSLSLLVLLHDLYRFS